MIIDTPNIEKLNPLLSVSFKKAIRQVESVLQNARAFLCKICLAQRKILEIMTWYLSRDTQTGRSALY